SHPPNEVPMMRLLRRLFAPAAPTQKHRAAPRLEALELRDVPSTFGRNLIANPGAEAGNGSRGGYDVIRPIPGWATRNDHFTVVDYGPTQCPASLPRGGLHFFSGGPSNQQSSATQTFALPLADALRVDQGGVVFRLAGFLGGYYNHRDNAVLTATFL